MIPYFTITEEDLYEEVGDQLRAKAADVAPIQEDDYVDDIQLNPGDDDGEIYDEAENTDKPPPPPPSTPHRREPPVPPPEVSSLPAADKIAKQAEPLPPPPIEGEIYDEAMSKEGPLPPPPMPETLPELPPSRGRARPTRELPKLPGEQPEKKKIKVQITYKPEEDFENRYFGKWDCTGSKDNELTFKQGDVIYILSREFEAKSWWVGELKGKFGLVPKTYLTPAFEPIET